MPPRTAEERERSTFRRCSTREADFEPALSDEVAVMRDGLFVERGPADRIFDAPRSDYTRALIAAAFRLEVVDGAVRQ